MANERMVSNHHTPPCLSGLPFYSRVAENCEDVAHFNEVSISISSSHPQTHLNNDQSAIISQLKPQSSPAPPPSPTTTTEQHNAAGFVNELRVVITTQDF